MISLSMILYEIISVGFVPLYQYTLSCYSNSLSINQCHFISHIFERLGFIPEFKNPSVVEFSVLSGVTSFLWSNAIRYVHMLIAFYYY